MLTERETDVAREICRILSDCGDYLLRDSLLRDTARRALSTPRRPLVSPAELDAAIAHLEGRGRILRTDTEEGPKWRLTDSGRSWYAENR